MPVFWLHLGKCVCSNFGIRNNLKFQGVPGIGAEILPTTVVTAIAPGRYAEPEHLAVARDIFAAVGSVVEVPEALMDAVTGLSGSGPAFVALMVEALSDGGVAAGLPRAIASQLALETANRGYVLEAGRLTIAGEAGDLLRDERVKQAYLG